MAESKKRSIIMTEGKYTVSGDTQLTGMAGEFLVAGKLFKRKYQVSITFGNAKAIDIFAHNPKIDRTFNIQVKTLRSKNCFPISKESVHPEYIYVFVILNEFHEEEEYFIVPGNTILADIDHFFGSCYTGRPNKTMPAINYGPLKECKDKWKLFETPLS